MPRQPVFYRGFDGYRAKDRLSGAIFPLARPSRVLCADCRVGPPFGGACHRRSARLALGAKYRAIIRAPS